MKYDDASWHYGGEFPEDLEPERGATHIGMFVSWCLLNDLAGELHTKEFPDALLKLKNRELTPGVWFIENCDEKFTDQDLNEIGNSFTAYYYESENGEFYDDYENAVGGNLESLYHIADDWCTFDKLSPVFKSKFEAWQKIEG